MGVHGLWKLLEPSGKPVPVETLENHVLAVDVSIWLHQLLQGYREAGGNSMPNAHLVGLFNRVCKLLFFRIKPVFVFDGGVPTLKKKTIAARHQQKDKALIASEKARQQLLKNLLKQKAVSQVLGDLNAVPSTSSQEKKDLYELPPLMNQDDNSESDDDECYICSGESSDEDVKKPKKYKDLHSIDVHSAEFKAMPADIRHDILTEVKETRKQSSWGRIHEMPEDLGQFSNYQMNRLLKRRSVQVSLEEAEKEMGGHTFSLGDVEALLTEQGIETSNVGTRIASDNTTRYLYITDSKTPAVEKSQSQNEVDEKNDELPDNVKEEQVKDETKDNNKILTKEESKNEINISETENICSIKDEFAINDVIKLESEDSSSDEITFEELNEEFEMNRKLMIENSGLTQEQILSIIKEQNKKSDESISKSTNKVPDNAVEIDRDNSNNQTSKVVIKSILGKVGSPKVCDSIIKDQTVKDNLEVNNLAQKNVSKTEENINNINETSNSFCSNDSSSSAVCDKEEIEHIVLENKEKNVIKDDCSLSVEMKTNKKNSLPSVPKNDSIHKKSNQSSTETSNGSTNDKSNPSVIQVTINTKPNESNKEDDIFSDIFSNSNHAEQKNGNVPKNVVSDNDIVEFMSSSDSDGSNSAINSDIETENLAKSEHVGLNTEEHSERVETTSEYFKSRETSANVEKEIKLNEHFVESSKEIDENKLDSNVNNEVDEKISSGNDGPESTKSSKKLTIKDLEKLQTILEKQEDELMIVQGKEERLATTVTEQMRLEAQELLQLFGVPWVMAPMEAEAQCAFLDILGLTQGTITDDSDVWLFGARKVYKNFFNQKKYVLQFQAQDIQHFFKLTRGDLIELALLVGSDYTVGVSGVGPVTALEIIAMFRTHSSTDSNILTTLTAFKNWFQHPSNSNSPLARKLKNVHLDEGFPSKDVVNAYLHPVVDESDETFSWGTPDLDGLRNFAKRKFGWSQARVDEILLPVMKNLSDKTSQTKIDTFFHIKPAIPIYTDKVSARVQKAIHRLGGETSNVPDILQSSGEPSTSKKKRIGNRERLQQKLGQGRGRAKPTPLVIEPPPPPKLPSVPVNEELIPQRERDRLEALKRKMAAIEVLKTKKSKAIRRPPRAPIKQDANLSESSSDEN